MCKSRRLIAVVDDEESVAKALDRLLRSAGLDAETFTSGRKFLDSLQDHAPDCVVLDLYMPEVDGFEVLCQLAQTPAQVPAVVISGRDILGARERAIVGGATAYLRKPVDDQALLDAIVTAIAPGGLGEGAPGASGRVAGEAG
jgi:FixJ family two-component response regulator